MTNKLSLEEVQNLFIIDFNTLDWAEAKIDRENKIRLLIAEDERSFRELLEEVFEECGYYNVLTAPDGKDAWEKFQNFEPRIVISDIMMDFYTGVELADFIRKIKPTQKVIFLSGWVTKEEIEEKFPDEFAAGNFLFVPKPFEIDEFQNTVYLFENTHLQDITVNTLSLDEINKAVRLLNPYELYTLHTHLWDKCELLSELLLDKTFKKEDITTLFIPVEDYQSSVDCKKSPEECRIYNCLSTNPDCVAKKLRNQIKTIHTVLTDMYNYFLNNKESAS